MKTLIIIAHANIETSMMDVYSTLGTASNKLMLNFDKLLL